MVDTKQVDLGLKVIGIVVLIVAVLFILTWSGVVKCKDVSPYWCDVYDSVMGGPRVLIVYSDSGLGDPAKLKQLLQDPKIVGANAVDSLDVGRVNIGNLKNYKLVIVDKAKELSAVQLQMFMDYVNKYGGRLVWVGDAGTQIGSDELRSYYDTVCKRDAFGVRKPETDIYGNQIDPDVNCSTTELKTPDNVWFRVLETDTEYKLINFDEFIGFKYQSNYCDQINCPDGSFMSVGALESEATGEHQLIYGTSPTLGFKIKKGRDFALVKSVADSSGIIVLSLNHGAAQGKTVAIPKNIPIVATSTIGLGERVAYYAYPPEWFAEDNNYPSYVKNMYYGMLGR